MRARRLELPVQTVELVVHPVDVRGKRSELVAVRDVDVAREVPGRDRGEPRIDSLNRADHRPREDEPQEQCQDESPRRDADDEIPRARRRTRVLCDQVVGLRRRRVGEHRGAPVEVHGEQLGPVTKGSLGRNRPAPGCRDVAHQHREAAALPTDLAQDPLVLGRRHEPEPVGTRGGPNACERIQDGPVQCGCRGPATRQPDGPDRVEPLVNVLREQQPHVVRVALELAVRERALLKGPEPFRSVVRLTEDSQSEQADGHHEHRSADECDEQLDVDPRRQAPDRSGDRVVAPAQRMPRAGDDPALAASLPELPTRAQGLSGAVPLTMLVISHFPSIRATSWSARVIDQAFPVFRSM